MPQAAAHVVFQLAAAGAKILGASGPLAIKIGATAVQITTAAAKVALLAGVNAVVANQNKPKDQGGLINLTINPNEPRRLQIGKRLNAGVLVDWYVKGSKNNNLFMIIYLGEGPMGQVSRVFAGGREVHSTPLVHATRTAIPGFRSTEGGEGGNRLWITYYDGRPGQTADATLVAESVGWTTNHIGTGCAYAIVEALWDSDNLRSPPQLAFEVEGAKFYDRRLDTTAGGSGSHRANDPSTWALSDNPAVALDHYLLGRYLSSVKTFGVGLDAEDVPYARFAALANLCDEDVDLKAGGTQKRYRANGFLFADRSYADTIKDLCRAMNARPADFGGRIGVIDSEERTPVMTLSDGDVIESAAEQYSPKRSWGELVSVVRGTFQDPLQNYQSAEYPRVTDATWVTEDGGSPKEATLDFEMETSAERAQRLAYLYAVRERRQAQLTGTYGLRAIELEQGDWFIRAGGIFGTSPGKVFEVIDRALDVASMTVTLTAFEVDPADSAWDENIAADPLPAPISSDDLLQAMEVPALTVTGITLTGTAAQLPAIRVQWTAPTDPRALQILVEAVPTAGGVPTSAIVDVGTGEVTFTSGITDDTNYLVRARFIGTFTPSVWTSTYAVTTLGDYAVGEATSVPWSGLTGDIPATVDNDVLRTKSLIILGLPDRPAVGEDFTSSGGNGTPASIAPLTDGTVVNVANEGDVRQFTSNAAVIHRGWLPVISGRTYRHRSKTRVTVDGTDNRLVTAFNVYDSSGAILGNSVLSTIDSNFVVADGWVISERTQTAANILSAYPTAAFIRGRLQGGRNGSNGYSGATWQLAFFRLEDGTDPIKLATIDEGADVTGDNTAAAIAGQGWGATASESAASNAQVPIGSNAIGNSEYYAGIDGWLGTAVSNTATMSLRAPGTSWAMPTRGTLMVYQPDAGTAGYFDVRWRPKRSAVATSYALKVQPGEQVAAAVHASAHRCLVQLRIEWRDAAGTVLSYTAAAENNATSASSTEPDAWPRLTRLGIAPASAAWAEIHIRKNPTLSGNPDSYMFLHKPMLTRIPATQAVVPDYTPGIALDVFGRADVTLVNTAAAITGQGALATKGSVDLATSEVTNKTASNIVYSGAVSIESLKPGESGANVTETRTAAAINAQGSQATANHQRGSTYSGTPTEGSWWSDTSTNQLKLYTGGVWQIVATIGNQNITITRTNGFVKTRIGSGTITSDAVSFSSTGGSGTGYTYAHTLFQSYSTGPTLTISSTSGTPITVSASGAVPGDEIRGFVQTVVTDSAGNTASLLSPVALFCES